MHPFFALGRIRIPAWGTLAALGAAVGAKVSYLFAAPGDVPLRLASGFVYYGGLWGGALAAAAACTPRGANSA